MTRSHPLHRALVAAGLAAAFGITAAFAGESVHDEIRVSIDTAEGSETFEVENLAIGEAREFTGSDGNPVWISRDEQGLVIDRGDGEPTTIRLAGLDGIDAEEDLALALRTLEGHEHGSIVIETEREDGSDAEPRKRKVMVMHGEHGDGHEPRVIVLGEGQKAIRVERRVEKRVDDAAD